MPIDSKKVKGFTLIELMMTLAIAAILVSLAAPSFTDTIKNNRLTTQYNELVTQLTLARSEAIKRNTEIIVLNNDGNESNWHKGWVIFEDTNDDDTVDAGETIKVSDTVDSNITISYNNGKQISYLASGLGNNAGTFTICDDRGAQEAKALIINITGRIRSATDSNSDGIVEGGNSNNVSCP